MLNLILYFHMHQPDYRKKGIFFMPWVFLHSIKDYYDMPYIASKFDVKVNFNLSAILIEQIQTYIKEGIKADKFLTLFIKHPSELNKDEKKYLLKILKSLSPKMITSSLKTLFFKDCFSDNEFIDFEILFLLSWCGGYLKSKPFIKAFLKKSHFKNEEKLELVNYLLEFLKEILPLYKNLQENKKISVTTTPYTHPIIPLLIDINVAKKANPNTILPQNPVSLRDDAILHIKKAKEIYKSVFSKFPFGFWPAEGGVDEKSIELYKKENIKIIATDEAILKKSGKNDIYKIYEFEDVKIIFRDHTLSDLIGFVYKDFKAENAAEDFYNRIQKKGIISVILDGENAWEYYDNNGIDFLNAFYKKLENVNTLLLEDVLRFESEKLDYLFPGSWIYGDFNTWVGDEEKNRAWELLFQTKRDYLRHKIENKKITQNFLKAEASDWFWWYGRGHYTEFSKEFDEIFRGYLIEIYELLNLPVPNNLLNKIIGSYELKSIINEPKNYITPVIDGKITYFFEWVGSGYIDNLSGAMQNNAVVKRIYFGEDKENIYFRLDCNDLDIDIEIFFNEKKQKFEMAKDEIIEIKIVKKDLKEFEVRFEIYKDNKLIEIAPNNTRFIMKIDRDYSRNWFI